MSLRFPSLRAPLGLLSALSLLAACAGDERGAVVYVDSELCADEVQLYRVRLTASGVDEVFHAAFSEAACTGQTNCAVVDAADFPLSLPVRSGSGEGTFEVTVDALDAGENSLACAAGELELSPTGIAGGVIVVRRGTSGACCAADALQPVAFDERPEATTCTPELVTPQQPIERIAVGAAHACMIDAEGRVFCWGSNARGQLGLGDSDDRRQPTFVRDLERAGLTAIDVAAGDSHTCAVVTADDTSFNVFCWGDNGQNQVGAADGAASYDSPRLAPGTAGARQLSLGPQHTCALFADGRVACWGSNQEGEAGQADVNSVRMPTTVEDVPPAIAIAAGGQGGAPPGPPRHTCALVQDMGGDAQVWCWGSNSKRQLGREGMGGGTPAQVEAMTLPANLTQIAAGQEHTCAVEGPGGQLWCWGLNNAGTLGVPAATQEQRPPTPIMGAGEVTAAVDPEGAAPPLTTIAAGVASRCVLLGDTGTPHCFGLQQDGRLGVLASGIQVEPVPVQDGFSGFQQIGLGLTFGCALPRGGGLPQCWGNNASGQLGRPTGATTTEEPPQSVASCG